MPMSYNPIDWCIVWFATFAGGFQQKLWISSCFVVFWSLWDHRNNLVFENKMMEWIELAYLIKIRVGFWLRGWCPECPFSKRRAQSCRVLREISGNGMLMVHLEASQVQ
ncbi:hypothetical protein TSUD_234360 [Trifolium subterraneum]|uniref:Reverse transcriptase zinc-binding domain-containing protein n=1 Tax=Trifolium subterraneum TaxID=3900 RepID=A0A2Z6LT72_TRISU|nr:hypothetical protein TSUD_234360 [Trifolium subterraneum]